MGELVKGDGLTTMMVTTTTGVDISAGTWDGGCRVFFLLRWEMVKGQTGWTVGLERGPGRWRSWEWALWDILGRCWFV
jgi:hypothetical protein